MTQAISFVCCVESGILEGLTVRMVESLRRWGGAFAAAPVFAVTARRGPGLSRETLQAFERLGVRYLDRPLSGRYSWFPYYNKPVALAVAEEEASTETMAWLDSDILIVGEPEALHLEDGIDFTACASEKEMGTTGEDDPFEPMWRANCQALGINIDSLPWIISEPDGIRMRVYWNSGVFAYRRSTRFGHHFLQACTRLMEARNLSAAKDFSISFNEMGAVALEMHRLGLSWRALPYSHNHSVNWRSYSRSFRQDEFRRARVIHHHDSMLPAFWDTFLKCLQANHPAVADWLVEMGSVQNRASLGNRLFGKVLRDYRDRQWRAYVGSCKVAHGTFPRI